MCRNRNRRRTAALVTALAAALSLSACGLSDRLFTDTGSGGQQKPDRENYLRTDALGQDGQANEGQKQDNRYRVLTLEKGVYTETTRSKSLTNWYGAMPEVLYSLEGVEARLNEYVVDHMQYVEAGDVIATVYTDVEEATLLEARTRLNRLTERLQDAQEQTERELEDILDEKAVTYNDYRKQILDIRYEQRQLDWEMEKYQYESQIEEAGEELEKLTKAGKLYEITTDTAGYIYLDRRYPAGTQLKEGDVICKIIRPDTAYQSTESAPDQFCYGMTEEIAFQSGSEEYRVVSGGSRALYGNLDQGLTVFRRVSEGEVDREQLTNYAHAATMKEGLLKKVENVILVPCDAVTEEDGKYYVTVLLEDGTLLKTQFLPGGGNTEEYWVLDGLTEGMQIVYD